jgi:hypothetical protein
MCQYENSPADYCIECFKKIFKKKKYISLPICLKGSCNGPCLNVCMNVYMHEFLKEYECLHIYDIYILLGPLGLMYKYIGTLL